MTWISDPSIRGRPDQELVDALVRANDDRLRASRLRRAGTLIRRDGEYERRHPEVARPFARAIEELAFPERRNGMDTIRPNTKKARKKGKRR